MKRCPQCGKEFPDDYQFCLEDAARLVLVVPAAPTSVVIPAPQENAGDRQGKPVGAIIGALVVLAAICGFAWQHSHSQAGAASVMSAGLTPQSSGTTQTDTSWQRYSDPALGIACDYPQGWTTQAMPSRASAGATRIVFQAPDPAVSILIDAETGTTGMTPMQKWEDLDARFRHAYKGRYQGQGIQPTTLVGAQAADWQSTLQKAGGPLLEREDIGSTIGGRDYALQLSAPPYAFHNLQPVFEHVAQSLEVSR